MANTNRENLPSYNKSIFSDFDPDNSEVLDWQENVLQKVKGDNILPHYIKKDRDFDIFWGWITHFFAIIVYFSRFFKRLFINYSEYSDEIGEFVKERDYIQDFRVKIDKDLTIPLTEELYHKIICDYKLVNGELVYDDNYNCTDFLPVTEGSFIILKVLGYNDFEEYQGEQINNIKINLYSSDKSVVGGYSEFNITAKKAKYGYRLFLTDSSQFCFIRISYSKIGNSLLPLYLGVFYEGNGSSFETTRSEKEIFDIFSYFRKRGTFKSSFLIKKVLESKKEDNFYANYLPQNNVGWFLNKNYPNFEKLINEVKIDSFIPQEITNSSNETTIKLKEQYFTLNQNNSIDIKWIGNNAISVEIYISAYDKDKNLLTNTPILGNWVFNSSNHTLIPSFLNYISSIPKYDSLEVKNIVSFDIEVIDNKNSATLNTDTFDKDIFLNNSKKIYLFCKYNNEKTKEVYYLKIDKIVIKGNDSSYIYNNNINNIDISLCLRKLPINLGFLNNKQYYLCYFKNNGHFSNKKSKEIISQKIIPYNGYRLFVDNSYYKNKINVPLTLKIAYFDKIQEKIHLEIFGGVPPYKYILNGVVTESYLSIYEKSINPDNIFSVNVDIIDYLGDKISTRISCQRYNKINYKFKIFIDKNNNISIYLRLFGGTETSYDISIRNYIYPFLYDNQDYQLLDSDNYELVATEYEEINNNSIKTIPANVWVDVTNLIGNNLKDIKYNKNLYIKDNGIPEIAETWLLNRYNDLELNLFEEFKNFAIDFYDNGKGILVETQDIQVGELKEVISLNEGHVIIRAQKLILHEDHYELENLKASNTIDGLVPLKLSNFKNYRKNCWEVTSIIFCDLPIGKYKVKLYNKKTKEGTEFQIDEDSEEIMIEQTGYIINDTISSEGKTIYVINEKIIQTETPLNEPTFISEPNWIDESFDNIVKIEIEDNEKIYRLTQPLWINEISPL